MYSTVLLLLLFGQLRSIDALALAAHGREASALKQPVGVGATPNSSSAQPEYFYSTNAICRQKNCINPVFPAYEDMPLLGKGSWQCTALGSTQQYLDFCKNYINYDFAIVVPNGSAVTVEQMVVAMDKAAATAYFYHLNGLQLDAWSYRSPEVETNACIRETWKLACSTYFPKQPPGCVAGQGTQYVRPCRNACSKYVTACDVECCDESARCVSLPTNNFLDNPLMGIGGYVDFDGPSAFCTGKAVRTTGGIFWLATIAILALSSTR